MIIPLHNFENITFFSTERQECFSALNDCNIFQSTSTNCIVLYSQPKYSGQYSTIKVMKHSKDLKVLFEQEPWTASFYQDASSLNSVKSLSNYYIKINKLLANKDYFTCNVFLKHINVADLSDVLLVGLLRLTYLYSEKISYWSILFQNSKNELSRRGYDATVLLNGLD